MACVSGGSLRARNLTAALALLGEVSDADWSVGVASKAAERLQMNSFTGPPDERREDRPGAGPAKAESRGVLRSNGAIEVEESGGRCRPRVGRGRLERL